MEKIHCFFFTKGGIGVDVLKLFELALINSLEVTGALLFVILLFVSVISLVTNIRTRYYNGVMYSIIGITICIAAALLTLF